MNQSLSFIRFIWIWNIISLSCAQIWLLHKIEFDEITTEMITPTTNITIGWIKIVECNEHIFNSTFIYSHTDHILDLQSYATSVKFIPSGGNLSYSEYAVVAKPCSNPVRALNNDFELSFTIDPTTNYISGFANLSNWIGTTSAKNRLSNTCYNSLNGSNLPTMTQPRNLSDVIYHACGNNNGMHLEITDQRCVWDNQQAKGGNIEMYYGFDVSKQDYCDSAKYVNIEVYSFAYDQAHLFNELPSFIKVNGIDYQVLSTNGVSRGLMVVILDEHNPSVLIDSVTFDTSSGYHNDSFVADYLNNTDPNHIVIMAVYGSAIGSGRWDYPVLSIPKTVSIINSWGCDSLTAIEHRNSFIFIGQASANNKPVWTYCKQDSNFSIYKNIQLQTRSSTTSPSLPSTTPTQNPTLNPNSIPTIISRLNPTTAPPAGNGIVVETGTPTPTEVETVVAPSHSEPATLSVFHLVIATVVTGVVISIILFVIYCIFKNRNRSTGVDHPDNDTVAEMAKIGGVSSIQAVRDSIEGIGCDALNMSDGAVARNKRSDNEDLYDENHMTQEHGRNNASGGDLNKDQPNEEGNQIQDRKETGYI